MTARTAGLLLWLLIGGLASSAVFWQLKHPPQPPVLPAATGARPPELPALTPVKPFRLPPPARYASITARPVFIAARQPEPPPPPDEITPSQPLPASPEPTPPTLMGVMIMPQGQVALLRPEEPNAKTARAKVGDRVGEWLLEAIFPNRVVLSKGSVKQELALVRTKKPLGSSTGKRNGPRPAPVAAPPDALLQPVPPPLFTVPGLPQQ
ncbi:MAG: hypothetical protein ACOYMW_04830 [Candidatus Competibacteraceae bacterium]